jgi:YVTN family beta-propeller protein
MYPSTVAITPDGSHAYVTNYNSNSVSVIDTATNTVTATVGVGEHPNGVAITPRLAADLQLQVTASPSPVSSHSFYTYTFKVTNHGPYPADWPRLVAHVPYGAVFQSYTVSDGYCVTPSLGARGEVTCHYHRTQKVGTTWIVALKVWAWAPVGTVITETAGTWAATHDPNTANNVVTINTNVQ